MSKKKESVKQITNHQNPDEVAIEADASIEYNERLIGMFKNTSGEYVIVECEFDSKSLQTGKLFTKNVGRSTQLARESISIRLGKLTP